MMDDAQNEAEAAKVQIPKTVQVGDREVTLTLPKSLSVRYEIAAFSMSNENRARFAALGQCWGGLGRPKARYETSYNVGQYGGEVLDELLQRGVNLHELRAAGAWALSKIYQSLPQPEEVDKAEGNSEAQGR